MGTKMRIYGGRLLKTMPGQDTRPTAARVREAVFNIWQGTITGCRWLDLCAGSGAMSAEALCRGAVRVVAIERSPRASAILQENLTKVATSEQNWTILRGDVLKRLEKLPPEQFDRIYFDPPYDSDLYLPVLEAIAHHQLLAPTGEIAVEHSTKSPPKTTATAEASLEICRQKAYGSTALTFYRPLTV